MLPAASQGRGASPVGRGSSPGSSASGSEVPAVAGVLFRVFWVGAPRWLYTALYLALGWTAVFYVVPFWREGGPLIGSLIGLGGLLYTAGGIVYGTKKPNPWPKWFGFHEVFHAFTLGGFATHFVAVALAVIGYRAAT